MNYVDMLYYDFQVPPSDEPEIEPYAGGLRFEIPEELGNRELAKLGLLDVTAAPFYADNTGEKDCTKEINEAIRTAQRYQLVCYFPLGTYKISDTIYGQQDIWWDYPYKDYRVTARQYPVVLMGERKYVEGQEQPLRPELYLAPNSPGFTNPRVNKYVVNIFRGKHPDRHSAPGSIGNMVTGININIGEGNYGAIGIQFYSAQGCSVEDCEINVGDGYCGVFGTAGNGGSHSQVIIRGGRVGIDVSRGTPGSVIEGFVFDDQREHAIIAGAKQAVTFVGCHIISKANRPPVVSFGGTFEFMQQGQLSLIDSVIEFENLPQVGMVQACISSRESIYLKNVYVKNATHAVLNPDGSEVIAKADGWTKVSEFAHGINTMPMWGGVYSANVFVDGKKCGKTLCTMEEDITPPADLLTRHRYHLPLWQDVLENNVVVKYGVVGDGIADDTKALQKAIDNEEYIFLPKGYYRITDTIKLRENTKIIGVAQNLSQILVTQSPDGAFADIHRNAPALLTLDTTEASVVLGYCGIVTARELVHVHALEWRCAGASLLRNFVFYSDPGYRITWMTKERQNPWILVTGNGGGRWYNFWCDIVQGEKDYRILKLENTHNPFYIYTCNAEHSRSDAEMEISGCKNVVIFAFKGEGNTPDLRIKNSDNIAVFTRGGDSSAYPGKALIYIENCTNIVLTLLNDYRVTTGHSDEYYSGTWYHPSKWHMLQESLPDGEIIRTEPWERPVVYKRGTFNYEMK